MQVKRWKSSFFGQSAYKFQLWNNQWHLTNGCSISSSPSEKADALITDYIKDNYNENYNNNW